MTRARRPEGEITRGTTAPNRLRRVDRWLAATQAHRLRAAARPLVVDLGYGASPITTVELYRRLRTVRPDLEVAGLEIDPARVATARAFLAAGTPRPPGDGVEAGRASVRGAGLSGDAQAAPASAGGGVEAGRVPGPPGGGGGAYPGLSFALGGFELPVDRPPVVVRAFNVLRQYDEAAAWRAWDGLCARLAPDGVLVEGTCDEIGRRACWVTLGPEGPRTITFAAHLASLGRPSDLAERLPKTLIHRNVPGERIHALLAAFDRCWATAAPHSAFGPRARWIEAVALLSADHPVRTPHRRRRLGELTLPWHSVAP